MKNSRDNVRTALIVLLLLSLFGSGWLYLSNDLAKIEAEKQRQELLSDKDLLNNEINDLIKQNKEASDINLKQKSRLDSLIKVVDFKDQEIQRLIAGNVSNTELKKKINELSSIRNELKAEVEKLKNELLVVQSANKDLEKNIDDLKLENEQLTTKLEFVKSLHANSYLVSGIKRSGKISAFSRWSKTIHLSFNYPEKYITSLDVKIIDPNGNKFSLSDKELVTLKKGSFIENENIGDLKMCQMELVLKPEKRFSKGVYKFLILQSSEEIETIQIQLK
jgi:outer membrane murein-binding lipoprotein Lpp